MKDKRYNMYYDVDVIINDDDTPAIMYNGKVLKQYLKKSNTGRNYYIVDVPKHGEQYVHRLVAYTYLKDKYIYKRRIYGIHERLVVDHINENSHDNRLSNLNWLTHGQNIKKINLIKRYKSGDNTLTDKQIKYCEGWLNN